MCRNPRIYLAGKMLGHTIEQAMVWRSEFIKEYSTHTSGIPNIFNPILYYNYEMPYDAYSDKEVFRYEMRVLKSSDIVVVNLNQIGTSVGTVQELAVAYDHNIPIIGLDESADSLEKSVSQLHPWIAEEIDKIFFGDDCYRKAASYIYSYYEDILI